MKTRPADLSNFSPFIKILVLATSAVVRGITANSGVATPKVREGGPMLGDVGRAKAGC